MSLDLRRSDVKIGGYENETRWRHRVIGGRSCDRCIGANTYSNAIAPVRAFVTSFVTLPDGAIVAPVAADTDNTAVASIAHDTHGAIVAPFAADTDNTAAASIARDTHCAIVAPVVANADHTAVATGSSLMPSPTAQTLRKSQ